MLYVDWFVKRMKKNFKISVPEEEVGYESYDFYLEDLDDLLIPVKFKEAYQSTVL